MKCSSCDGVMSPKEIFRTVEIEDGKTMEIIDNTCNDCLGNMSTVLMP